MTDYQELDASGEPWGLESTTGQRLLRQEELLCDAQDAIALAMRETGIGKAELASLLGRTQAYVSKTRRDPLRWLRKHSWELAARKFPGHERGSPEQQHAEDCPKSFKLFARRRSRRRANLDVHLGQDPPAREKHWLDEWL